ncbi:MAG: VCBS repeat-containing protein [Gemmatimonadales bacterium]|nr:VCBS repeat-containing protein [Gemmatimonadales bacterium]
MAACAGGGAPRTAPAARGLEFRSVVSPFSVIDTAGRPLALPFVGGFNAPRPQLVDADGDGDLDLFVQEVTGSVALYEREGEEADGQPRFVFRTPRYGDLDVGEWYRFADVDADGDLDLLAEQPFSYIKYYRNDGQRGAYRFVLAADTLRDTDGTPIFSDRQNIPQLGDLDCNGRSDLLIGRLDGTVGRYEAVPPESGRAPAFRLVAQEFEGIRIVGQQVGPPMPLVPGPSMHGANTMALADHDGDGNLDLFWGDFFEPGLLLIPNTGTCPAPNFRSQPVQFPVGKPLLTSGYNAPAFGDLSGDGRADLVVGVLGGAYNPLRTSAENLYYLSRGTSGEWEVRSRQLLPVLDIGSETIPAIADLDGDGDLDLLLANKLDPSDLQRSFVYWLENVGNARRPAFRLRAPLELGQRFHAAPAFGDLDADGRLDLIVGQWGPRLAWYRGTPGGYEAADTALVTITRGSNTVPTLGDLDGDGDLDLIVGESSGWLNYYRNDGDTARPVFTLVSDEFDRIQIGRRSAPLLADLDGDGDLDLLVGSESSGLALFRNVGTRTAPRLVRDSAFRVPAPVLAAPSAGDLDGDGDLDLIVGGAGGGAIYLERIGAPDGD